MYGALDTSTSALVAYRTNMDVIAANIAMKDVTRDDAGSPVPFRRRVALFAPGDPSRGADAPGVHVAAVAEGRHKGYVRVSNVDYHTEMVNAITAARAYEANVTVMEMAKRMAGATLRLIA